VKIVSLMATQPCNSRLQPPAYDTLSLGPPSADTEQVSRSAQSQTPDNGQPSIDNPKQSQLQQPKKSFKERWHALKEEDERRKAQRIQHVSREEADRITGLDRHREAEAEAMKKGGPRGIKSVLGILMLS